MQASFGKGDWVANGAMFTAYHLHQPWSMPATLLDGIFAQAYPTKRFRSICYSTPIKGTFDREWFALLLPSAMPGSVAPQCGKLVVDLKRDAGGFADQVLAAETAARRASVYSDFIREALKKYRIDYDTWRP